jgi:Pyruvate/2-oxoacid:ferredoxin oxidoreductase delta subunit
MSDILPFMKLFLPLMGGVVAWYFNERRKRSWEEYIRKEENYKSLIYTSRAFYVGSQDKTMKEKFLDQVNMCWLYCPDDVIRKAYKFLSSVETGTKSTSAERQNALGELIVAIRYDLQKRKITRKSNLNVSEYRILSSL